MKILFVLVGFAVIAAGFESALNSTECMEYAKSLGYILIGMVWTIMWDQCDC